MSKVIAIVSFRLPQRKTLDQAAATFQTTAPKYLNLPGLLRKNYFLTEDGMRAGGIYLWESRQAAERVYTPSGKLSSRANTATSPRSSTSIRRCWWTMSRAGSPTFEHALLSALCRAADAGRSRRR